MTGCTASWASSNLPPGRLGRFVCLEEHPTCICGRPHARIYRIAYGKAPKPDLLRLSKNDATELVAALKSDNLFWRNTAQRLLVERGQKDVAPALAKLAGELASLEDEKG